MEKDLVADAGSIVLFYVGGLLRFFCSIALRVFEEVLVHAEHLAIFSIEAKHPMSPIGLGIDKDDPLTVRVVVCFRSGHDHV